MSLADKLRDKCGPIHPNSRIAAALAQAGVARSPEFRRIEALPRRVIDLANVPDMSPAFRQPTTAHADPHCSICREGVKLRPIQSAMLIEASGANGGFFPVGVGHGKTLASLLMPLALASKRAVLLVPPNLRAQLLHADVPLLSAHFTLPRVCTLADITKPRFNTFQHNSVLPGVEDPNGELVVIAYTELSAQGTADALEACAPDLIIADECHLLRHKDAARTKRFLRYFKDHPETRFVAMSGTITSKSIKDYAHLVELALKKNSPLPNHFPDLAAWADALDVDGKTGPGVLMTFCGPAPTEDDPGALETVRQGFRRRLVETPGIVATEEGAIGTSLEIQVVRTGDATFKMGPISKTWIANFEHNWTIGGMEIDSAAHAAKVTRRLAMGFYYRWVWGTDDGVPDREWMLARNEWSRAIRERLVRHSAPGHDSPGLVEESASRGEWWCAEWEAWKKVKDRPGPQTTVEWVDRTLIKTFAQLAQETNSIPPTIVWINDPPLGWALNEVGIPYFGEQADKDLAVASSLPPGSYPIICCSIKAHATGKNLQAWSHNIVLWPPSSGAVWEQMLGRTHRPGQMADTVSVGLWLPLPAAERSWESALNDAGYIESTTGQRQKLRYASIIEKV